MSQLRTLPCLDSEQMAASRRRQLDIARDVADVFAERLGVRLSCISRCPI